MSVINQMHVLEMAENVIDHAHSFERIDYYYPGSGDLYKERIPAFSLKCPFA